ncbi:hypothetical protein SEVIR_9G207800v4 [Setaria viridis]|uniref:Basic secretory protease n=2 Tax=Setaria TaxID=4554 RepID=K4AEQ8_SETIT|nr:uncharacterized protein LOC101755530 [Setaria italica]XP_034571870.1 uncharacterized protein LOC117836528 [Setaria viridis]RCV42345.1 hypothetical protein SETIT_9G209100v2 [Setaria italica]TKV93164.1 hypothetical protein SEVIR_9G207800v2 [Setaria viridis]
MKLPAAVIAVSSVLLVMAATSGAVTFDATNSVASTDGGARFDREVGVDYAKQVLSDASSFIWGTFNQPNPEDRKPVDSVALNVVDNISAPAQTSGGAISLNAQYVAGFQGDVKTEVTGVLYHETTHVWQWDGQGQANGGLIEGIADFVRLRAGLAPDHWRKAGQGDKWDQGYDVTARFLDYCDSLKQGFVAELNGKMKDGYSDGFFQDILGKDVQQLWQDYKAQYGG